MRAPATFPDEPEPASLIPPSTTGCPLTVTWQDPAWTTDMAGTITWTWPR